MTKTKIFLAIGAIVLAAVGGILAGRASTKFAAPTRIYYTMSGSICKTLASAMTVVAHRLTTVGGICQAELTTEGCSASLHLYATSTCVKPIYFFPNR